MVNANEDDVLHTMAEFEIDGSYIPRLIFLSAERQVLQDVQNSQGNPKYKYYHYNADSVTRSMKQVLELYNVKDEL